MGALSGAIDEIYREAALKGRGLDAQQGQDGKAGEPEGASGAGERSSDIGAKGSRAGAEVGGYPDVIDAFRHEGVRSARVLGRYDILD
jgi:hypothetical protein